MPNLSDNHINWIRNNIRNRGITSIDLEYEMVDHIASATEEQMSKGLSFRDAFKNVMFSFGPYGMEKLQEKKTKELHSRGYKLLWKNVLLFFRWPKILLTASVFFSSYVLLRFLNPDQQFISASLQSLGMICLLIGIGFFWYSFRLKYEELRQIYFSFYIGCLYPLCAITINFVDDLNMSNMWIVSGFLTGFLICNLAYFQVMKQIQLEIHSRYPQHA